MINKITIDLSRPPEDRWHLTPEQQQRARELLSLYKADLGIPQDVGEFLTSSARELVRADHWAELESLSRTLGLPLSDTVLCNFYYDALKVVLGCTAFAVDSAGGVLHARNLDWWTTSAILSRGVSCLNVPGRATRQSATAKRRTSILTRLRTWHRSALAS